MFSTDIISEITAAANALNVEPAALLAVAEVESGGKAFALINGRREPLIRFEGHYFDRRLNGPTQVAARKARLAHPRAGAIANPATQAARWAILRRAATIDHQAAHESVSWGLGQVMGAHWRWLGYANIDELVAEARRSVAGQATLMARYVDKAGLTTTLPPLHAATMARTTRDTVMTGRSRRPMRATCQAGLPPSRANPLHFCAAALPVGTFLNSKPCLLRPDTQSPATGSSVRKPRLRSKNSSANTASMPMALPVR